MERASALTVRSHLKTGSKELRVLEWSPGVVELFSWVTTHSDNVLQVVGIGE